MRTLGAKRDEYNWLDDAFDDKKAREELERAQRGGTKAAGVGCIVVVLALVVLLVFTLVSGVSILSAM